MKTEMRDKLAESLLLYAVTDRHWLGDRTLYDVVRESLDGGVTFLQLREKDLDDETFFREAVRLRDMAREYGVPFVINDNVDIAVRMDADPTGSKDDADDVSFETLKAICEAVSIPVVAIGGITAENTPQLAGSGICGIAVISAIYGQKDIYKATASLKKITREMVRA